MGTADNRARSPQNWAPLIETQRSRKGVPRDPGGRCSERYELSFEGPSHPICHFLLLRGIRKSHPKVKGRGIRLSLSIEVHNCSHL